MVRLVTLADDAQADAFETEFLPLTGNCEQHYAVAAAVPPYPLWWWLVHPLYQMPPMMPFCDDSSWCCSGGRQNWKSNHCGGLRNWSNVPFKGNVWNMACDTHGCRELQKAFDQKSSKELAALGQELKGHVWDALQCKNANHVVQKYICSMGPEHSQFIIDEIMSQQHGAWIAARHCFGCRIFERLLEHCCKLQVKAMCDEILVDAADLCKHQYGNFVAQHLLAHGLPEHSHRLAMVVRDHIALMCNDYHGVAVVSAILRAGTVGDQVSTACAVLDQQGLVLSMARGRHGQEAVKHLLQAPSKEVREEVWRLLTDNVEKLRSSRYGRVIVNHLSSLSSSCNAAVAGADSLAKDIVPCVDAGEL